MKISPYIVLLTGLLICSMGFNILYSIDNKRLLYRVQKLEAGPARGLFLEPEIPKPNMSDEEMNELLKEIMKKILRERTV